MSRAAEVSGDLLAKGEKLLFLVSQPRAGSTLMQRILAGSSNVKTASEPWIMLHPIYALREQGLEAEYDAGLARTALAEYLEHSTGREATFEDAVRAWAMALYGDNFSDPRTRYFLDKTPRYYFILPDLKAIFPKAKFILLIRNPMGVLNSILRTWVKGNWPMLAYYRNDLLRAPKELAAGIDESDPRVYVIRYEDLVQDARGVTEATCAFLGIDYDERMIHYGARPELKGSLGDPVGIERHNAPVPDSVTTWMRMADDAQAAHFARGYLDELGQEVLDGLGYSMAELSEPFGEPGAPDWRLVPWKLALKTPAEQTFRERLRVDLAMRVQRGGVFRGVVGTGQGAIGQLRRSVGQD